MNTTKPLVRDSARLQERDAKSIDLNAVAHAEYQAKRLIRL